MSLWKKLTSVRRRLPRALVRRVAGDSMAPTLAAGQLVVAVGPATPCVGQVVILLHDGLEKIKRVQQVRPGQIFVVGDHAAHSTDSRTFGWVDIAQVRGRVIWPRGLPSNALVVRAE